MKTIFNSRVLARQALTLAAAASAGLLLPSCGSNDDGQGGDTSGTEPRLITSTVVFDDEGQTSYLSLLPDFDAKRIDLHEAREFPGWANVFSHHGHLFIGDGESPTITKYSISDGGKYTSQGSLSFLDYGVGYVDTAFVAPDKAYMFGDEVVIWNPETMEIGETFPLPKIEPRDGGLEHSQVRSGRGLVQRGDRIYVATSWANWDTYSVAEESLIVVLDTKSNQVVDMLPVDCPYLDVATIDDDGNLYFSNWVYTVGDTLLKGKRKACAARIRAGEETIDSDWTLTFADVTGGHEAAAMRYLGDGKALISVFYEDQADLSEDPAAIADTANWRFWTLDLSTREASLVEEIDFFAGGYNMAKVDGRSFLLVPSEDYATTTIVELHPDGTTEERWTTPGWSIELHRLRGGQD